MELPYKNRTEAGRLLAGLLNDYRNRDGVIVLALPRGGVPVAWEIAQALPAALDLITVRKLGLPGHVELAMGAIASGGVRVMNHPVIELSAVSEATVEQVVQNELAELDRREQRFRGSRPRPRLDGRCVILVDDGVATGATMQAAVEAVRKQAAAEVVVAVPVAPPLAVKTLQTAADRVIAAATPESFSAISQWYQDFTQIGDEEVAMLLERIGKRDTAPA